MTRKMISVATALAALALVSSARAATVHVPKFRLNGDTLTNVVGVDIVAPPTQIDPASGYRTTQAQYRAFDVWLVASTADALLEKCGDGCPGNWNAVANLTPQQPGGVREGWQFQFAITGPSGSYAVRAVSRVGRVRQLVTFDDSDGMAEPSP